MNKKQVIRINESQLRQIVAESVNSVLNELDWKTYVNAARKAGEKGDSRKEKFLNHANNTIKQQYPNRNNKYHTELEHNIYDFVDGDENFEPFLDIDNAKMKYSDKSKAYHRLHHKTTGEEFDYSPGTTYTHGTKVFDKDGTKYNGRGITRDTDLSTNHAGFKRPYNLAFHFEEPTSDYYDDGQWDWDKMSKDMEDYYTGKSHYVKGKGWVSDNEN